MSTFIWETIKAKVILLLKSKGFYIYLLHEQKKKVSVTYV